MRIQKSKIEALASVRDYNKGKLERTLRNGSVAEVKALQSRIAEIEAVLARMVETVTA